MTELVKWSFHGLSEAVPCTLLEFTMFWRTRKGEFWFMPPLILYLVNHCITENLIANIRCSVEPLLDPDLYFG